MKLKSVIKNIFNANNTDKKPKKSTIYYLTARKEKPACEQYILTTKRYAAESDPSSITNFYTDVNLNHLYDPEDGYYGWNITYNDDPIYTGYIHNGCVSNIKSCLITTSTTTLPPTTTTTTLPPTTTTTTLPPTTTSTTTLPPTYVVTAEITPTQLNSQLINFGGSCYNPQHHISEYGMVLNTIGNPTIYDSSEVQGKSNNVSDLIWYSQLKYVFSYGVTYYLKAYVKIAGKYYYGDEKIYLLPITTTTTSTTLKPITTTTTTTKKAKDRVLFILKDRVYQKVYSQSYGLYNSAKMVMNYLESTGNVCEIKTVIDANFIDAEVYKLKPTVVIIEALWVTGAKMKELSEIPRYKNIKWVIRIHSDIGFLAAEARAFKYIREYIDLNNKNVIVSCNNKEFNAELSKVCNYDFEYLPNIFDFEDHDNYDPDQKDIQDISAKLKLEIDSNLDSDYYKVSNNKILKIASFGALRVLKNQMFQAMCAIIAADKMNMTLHFHINGGIQNPYNPVLSNMKEMFELNGKHQLFVHGWLEHSEFDKLIKAMDLGLQISYTESFNIVSADFVFNGVPIVVSDSIDWMPKIEMSPTTKYEETAKKIIEIYHNRKNKLLLDLNKMHLMIYNSNAKWRWNRYIK